MQNSNPFWGPQIETNPTLLTDPATGAGGRRLRAGTDGRLRTRPDRGGPNGNGFAIVPRLEFPNFAKARKLALSSSFWQVRLTQVQASFHIVEVSSFEQPRNRSIGDRSDEGVT